MNSQVENVSSSRRSRKPRKLLLFPVRTPSAFLRACGLPEAEMRAPSAREQNAGEKGKKREDEKRQRKEANTAKSRVLGLRERL
jgi:hypothetical protein